MDTRTQTVDALKWAQDRLILSEERLKLALHAAHLGWWRWYLPTGSMECSPKTLSIVGLNQGEVLNVERFRHLVHAEDVEEMWAFDEVSRTGRPYQGEYRIIRPDGQLRWVTLHAMSERDEMGGLSCVVGTLDDITERRQNEEALFDARLKLEARAHERARDLMAANDMLSKEIAERQASESQVRTLFGLLANAEEEERRRLARDVHDAMGQHVAALTLGLKTLQADPSISKALRGKLSCLLDSAHRLDGDIDGLAYRLHPTILDDLGLDDALLELARTWSASSGTPVDVHTRGLRGERFAQALEIAVYRVVQESLTNVRKHAAARHVSLIVERRDRTLRAIVEDDGQGFEPVENGRPGQERLGLRIMAERAAQIGGQFDVESSSGHGTAIYFSVPLGPVQD